MKIHGTYDPGADAMTIEVAGGEWRRGTVEAISGAVMLDYLKDGRLASIELLGPRRFRGRLATVAAAHGFGHLLDGIYVVMGILLDAKITPPWRYGQLTATYVYRPESP